MALYCGGGEPGGNTGPATNIEYSLTGLKVRGIDHPSSPSFERKWNKKFLVCFGRDMSVMLAPLILAHQPRVAHDICRKDGRRSPYNPLAGQRHPPWH